MPGYQLGLRETESLSVSVVHIFYKLFFNVKIFIKLIHVK